LRYLNKKKNPLFLYNIKISFCNFFSSVKKKKKSFFLYSIFF
jgi:hypothetical protein